MAKADVAALESAVVLVGVKRGRPVARSGLTGTVLTGLVTPALCASSLQINLALTINTCLDNHLFSSKTFARGTNIDLHNAPFLGTNICTFITEPATKHHDSSHKG